MNQLTRCDRLIQIRAPEFLTKALDNAAGKQLTSRSDYIRIALLDRLKVDGIDPAFAPGTGTPEVGGLTPREAQAILHGLAGVDVIGGDVVEVAPQYDPTTNTAMAGAQMLFEILSLMTLGKHSPRE